MKVEKNRLIERLSESEFLSLLYSERERENSLNQVPGWSRWAILGVWVTVFCTAYVILKENSPIDFCNVLYLTGSFLAFLLTSSSFWRLSHFGRRIDYSRVKFLKEALPITQFCFVFFCAVLIAIGICIIDEVNIVLWLWVSLLLVYLIALIIALFLRKTIVPAFYYDFMFPRKNMNIIYEGILTLLYLLIFHYSFKRVSCSMFSSEFELSVCIACLIALAYLFFRICSKDDVVKRIDDIIEGYLYRAVSKEETFRQISINRWGYTVIDACEKELSVIEKRLEDCERDLNELKEIESDIQMHDVTLEQIGEFLSQVYSISVHQTDTLALSDQLSRKLSQTLEAAPTLQNEPAFVTILNSCQVIASRIGESNALVSRISDLVEKKHKQIRNELMSAREDIERCKSTD